MARSLRSRIVLGAVLWTIGLLAVANVLTLNILHYNGSSGLIIHSVFISFLAGACMLAGFGEVRKGLAPFARLRAQLIELKEGRGRRVDGSYPDEVQPLIDDLNALLDHRERALERALAKAGDLAHGLKTPLAVLAHEAERAGASGQHGIAEGIEQQVARMRRQVEYHLAHARAAASGTASGASCEVRASIEGLVRTLERLYAERGLTFHLDVDAAHGVRVRREELDEMLGNLLDNACKWARATVTIASRLDGERIVITVDDDGAGLAPSLRDVVLQRGARADEAAPGSGLGLAIVRDLAELSGGAISLDTSDRGGFRARLSLPAR